ncbi:MAG TPA: DUF2807 domain-containing protein [Rhizomicrobium sp.]|nr:DUF2807 domain-containing protein [Rhizomicrobium sp.]
MAKAFLAGLAFGLLFGISAADSRTWDGYTAREPVMRQPGRMEWRWDGGDRLGIDVPATVHYSAAGPVRVVITGSDDLLAHIRFGQGHIWFEEGLRMVNDRDEKLDVQVSGMPLHDIAINGSGRMMLGRIDQDSLRVAIRGSGAASAEGRVDHLDLAIMGSGNADFEHVASRQADIHIAGSGHVSAAPHDEVNITIAGSGDVRLAVRPAKVNRFIAGSGDIHMPGPD